MIMSEAVMLDMMGHMVVLGTAKFSHLQHTVYETGSQVIHLIWLCTQAEST